MRLPRLNDFDFKGKSVLLRCDLDVVLVRDKDRVRDDTRLRECLPTINYLLEQGASEIILMGHLGRPGGKVTEELSLKPVAEKLNELLVSKCKVQSVKLQFKVQNFDAYQISENIILLENLRFDEREEENDEGFAKELAGLGDFYVNEAFAASHREHASIVGVPKFLPHCAGLHFASEVENLSKVIENPKRPVVVVIGGAKTETKMAYMADLTRIANAVLVGGTLVQSSKFKVQSVSSKLKVIVCADLTEDGFDIDEDSIKKFCDIIKSAGTVVWNGPLGKVEDERWEVGTRKIAEAIVKSRAFKVVGGGDTIAALKKFNLIDKMDYVSTGGGAMLEFLAKGTLPGIDVLISKDPNKQISNQ